MVKYLHLNQNDGFGMKYHFSDSPARILHRDMPVAPGWVIFGRERKRGQWFSFANYMRSGKIILRMNIHPLREIFSAEKISVFGYHSNLIKPKRIAYVLWLESRQSDFLINCAYFDENVCILWKRWHFAQRWSLWRKVGGLVKMVWKSINKPLATDTFERVCRKDHKFHKILHFLLKCWFV